MSDDDKIARWLTRHAFALLKIALVRKRAGYFGHPALVLGGATTLGPGATGNPLKKRQVRAALPVFKGREKGGEPTKTNQRNVPGTHKEKQLTHSNQVCGRAPPPRTTVVTKEDFWSYPPLLFEVPSHLFGGAQSEVRGVQVMPVTCGVCPRGRRPRRYTTASSCVCLRAPLRRKGRIQERC